MTNNTLNFFITGSGSIGGATSMFKTGTGSLDIEGNTTLSVEVNQGLLAGAGTISAATIRFRRSDAFLRHHQRQRCLRRPGNQFGHD